ncbi:MAG: hypothetical protein DCC75_05955 [Proteobacteria bacterium]|nr:MAG: hypothetical protein DCC75_05955 [Pseudomonadota bacterium]
MPSPEQGRSNAHRISPQRIEGQIGELDDGIVARLGFEARELQERHDIGFLAPPENAALLTTPDLISRLRSLDKSLLSAQQIDNLYSQWKAATWRPFQDMGACLRRTGEFLEELERAMPNIAKTLAQSEGSSFVGQLPSEKRYLKDLTLQVSEWLTVALLPHCLATNAIGTKRTLANYLLSGFESQGQGLLHGSIVALARPAFSLAFRFCSNSSLPKMASAFCQLRAASTESWPVLERARLAVMLYKSVVGWRR